MKKTLALTLALIMVLAMIPSVALAAQTHEVDDYDGLVAALSAASTGDTIKLTADINTDEVINVYNSPTRNTLTIDMNGHNITITNTNGKGIMVTDVTLTLQGTGKVTLDSSDDDSAGIILTGTSTLNIGSGVTVTSKNDYTICIDEGCTVNSSGTIENTYAGEEEGYAIWCDGGTLNVKDGTITGADCGIMMVGGTLDVKDGTVKAAFALYVTKGSGENTISITGGEFVGAVALGTGSTAPTLAEGSKRFIKGGSFSVAPDSSLIADGKAAVRTGNSTDATPFTIESVVEGEGIAVAPTELNFGSAAAGYSGIGAKTVYIYGADQLPTVTSNSSDYEVSNVEEIKKDGESTGNYRFAVRPKDGLSAGTHDAAFTITAVRTTSGSASIEVNLEVKATFKVTASGTAPSTSSGISLWYDGGNSFGSSKSAVPTSVEIDGTPVSFTGTGSSLTVSCVKSDAKWVTVRWNSTTVTTSFTPDAAASCASVAIPKTGDMPIWEAIAEFFGF